MGPANVDETNTGGANRGFRSTVWEDVEGAADSSNPGARDHMDRLIRRYWKPVYIYIRKAWHRSVEDAKELTQAFFARIIEKKSVAAVSRDRGSFRAYLRRALKNFLINAKESETVRKPREGSLVSLEVGERELEELGRDSAEESPEAAYDREWFRNLIVVVTDELRERLNGQGKERDFEIFRLYCFQGSEFQYPEEDAPSPSDRLTYTEIAERMGLKDSDVRNSLVATRQVFRRLLKRQIAEYVDNDEEIERELREALQ